MGHPVLVRGREVQESDVGVGVRLAGEEVGLVCDVGCGALGETEGLPFPRVDAGGDGRA